jgi:transketolase
MALELAGRRGRIIQALEAMEQSDAAYGAEQIAHLDDLDLTYRSLCALMFNFVPGSGHPGGSISSGRIVQGLLFGAMDYDLSRPDEPAADIISYAAGHKALGLYALWALRNEVARIGSPQLLPKRIEEQLRLEDLLGFRRNPTSLGPLAREHRAKALDGHPTPATPFIRLSTGASGVGVSASLGLALGAIDTYRDDPPRVHIIEGEGGMTPGRVQEAFAAAGTMGLSNVILHVDWNQASIDTNHVCRDDGTPGDYVQWNPVELLALHDWNVIVVQDGFDFREVLAAQREALAVANGQPTAVVYRTVKGWRYGIEGRASHGAGHPLCSEPFYTALEELHQRTGCELPRCDDKHEKCGAGSNAEQVEICYWEALQSIRSALEERKEMTGFLAGQLEAARDRFTGRGRQPREDLPRIEVLYDADRHRVDRVPEELRLEPGQKVALRAAFGQALRYYNRESGGSVFAAAADLLGSTSVNAIGADFADGFYHARDNANARSLAIGGICEDAISGMLAGLSTFGRHIGVGSSYGAFIAPLGHISVRLHGIGNQARREIHRGEPYKPVFLVCAHAGFKTGEDGPTHADPQPLQLLEENFPRGIAVTLTPWEPQEMWPLVTAALQARPAVIAPFVTRPAETVIDRTALGLAPASMAAQGVYPLVEPDAARPVDATVVMQGSEVTYAFVLDALPRLREAGLNLRVVYVASSELFDLLPPERRARLFPAEWRHEAMGITGFTMPTLYRWVCSELGRSHTLHAYRNVGYPGSGHGSAVLAQAGLDGRSQAEAIQAFAKARRAS